MNKTQIVRIRTAVVVLAVVGLAFAVGTTAPLAASVHSRLVQTLKARLAQTPHATSQAAATSARCLGAAAITAPKGQCTAVTKSGRLTPTAGQAKHDYPHAYPAISHKKNCFASNPHFVLATCSFGVAKSSVQVALVGNSHAGEWVDAVDRIAKAHNWHVTTYLAFRCAFANIPQQFDTPAGSAACTNWVNRAARMIASRPYDLVIMTDRVSVPIEGGTMATSHSDYLKGYTSILRGLKASGKRVVGLRDTPALGLSVPDCLASHRTDYTKCAGTRRKVLPSDPIIPAIQSMHDRKMITADLSNHICVGTICPAAVGGVPVYIDASHMTNTYAKTLAPYLNPILVKALKT